ncbi:MAG: DUF4336 domain-containing protein [Sphingomonas sp.]|uniref:DUF4336 domain-containing protein n=1 Tax=Sphingomonas sp. TaxID=28214 RepID=UPI003F81F564
MTQDGYRTYDPLGVLKPVAENIWIVDGPEIRFRYALLRIPFPTRMTVVRLPDGGLWLHSPTPADVALVEQVRALGPVTDLIAPNTIHYWWVKDWSVLFPAARVWAVSRMARGARHRLPPHRMLGEAPPPEWGGAIDQLVVTGSRVIMEAEFFHRPSRTLIMTDMIENFEESRFRSRFYRWLSHIGGVVDPDGRPPSDIRFSFRGRHDALRRDVETMIGWAPERLIMAHGRWYPTGAVDELHRAFRFVL